MSEKEFLSKEGLENINQELEGLYEKRKEVAERLKYAKSLGDLSENAEYKEAKNESSLLEEKIAHFENVVKRAVVVTGHKGGEIDFGSIVVVQKKGDTSSHKYQIVGHEEANISESKISNESPIGVALIGKKKGDAVVVLAPNGDIEYKIINVE